MTRYPTLMPAASDHPLRRTRVPKSWAAHLGPTWQCAGRPRTGSHRARPEASDQRSDQPRDSAERREEQGQVRLTTPTPPLQTTSRRTPVRPPALPKHRRRGPAPQCRAWDTRKGWQDQSRVSNPNQRLKTTCLNRIVLRNSAAIRRAFDASVDQRPWLGGGRVRGLQSPGGQPARRHGGTAAGADPSPGATGVQWRRPGVVGAGAA